MKRTFEIVVRLVIDMPEIESAGERGKKLHRWVSDALEGTANDNALDGVQATSIESSYYADGPPVLKKAEKSTMMSGIPVI